MKQSLIPIGIISLALVVLVSGCQSTSECGCGGKNKARNFLLPATEKTSPFLSEANFITTWNVLGPFKFKPSEFKEEQQQDATEKEFIDDEDGLKRKVPAPAGLKWQNIQFRNGKQAGQIGLEDLYGPIDYACAYAVACVEVPVDIAKANLQVGSDDYLKIWLNGDLVHTYKVERRASDWDQDIIKDIELRKGCNRIVVKCVDIVGDWDFYLRFTDKEGMPFTCSKAPTPAK